MRLSEFNISETVDRAIAEHIKRGVPFTECMFRPGSEAFTMFYRGVREMRESIDMDWFDSEMLDTDIGECVEIDGEIVPLDVPIEDLTEEVEIDEADWGTRYQSDKRRLAMYNPDSNMYMGKSMPGNYKKPDPIDAADEIPADLTVDSDPDKSMNQQDLKKVLAKALKSLKPEEAKILMMRFSDNMTLDAIGKELGVSANRVRQIHDKALRKLKHPSRSSDLRSFLNNDVNEAEYQGRKVKLNSPKRGGPKKYYVYTKNKKGNVIKVSWGDTTGLKTKANNPGAVKSFVARHDCKNKKDKTKAGYWACRTPRYKSLGVKGGQWW